MVQCVLNIHSGGQKTFGKSYDFGYPWYLRRQYFNFRSSTTIPNNLIYLFGDLSVHEFLMAYVTNSW